MSDSLSKKQQEITKLGKEVASVESDMRNSRSQLEAKQSELNGNFTCLPTTYFRKVKFYILQDFSQE